MNAYQKITNKIIQEVKQTNTLPWQKPWLCVKPTNIRNYNPKNNQIKDYYKGINKLMLHYFGDGSEFYMTFNQVKKMGGKIKKGSSGVPIFFLAPVEKKEEAEKEEESEKEKQTYFCSRCYYVFSQNSIEGIEFPDISINKDKHQGNIESFIKKIESVIPFNHTGNSRCYYSPSHDYISTPKFNRFTSAEEYYSAVFHELVHATGHENRLNRLNENSEMGKNSYSFEELVAEIGSTFLLNHFGVDIPKNNISYLKHWLKKIEDNPSWIVKAANKAEKATEWLLASAENKNIKNIA